MRSYTKELMVEALKKLLKTKPLNKITVNDIVCQCNASKQTFYNHFSDKYDLFDFALTTVLSQNLIDSARDSHDFKTTILSYYRRVLAEKGFYRSFIRDDAARQFILDCIANYCYGYFRERAQAKLGTEDIGTELQLSFSFFAAGSARLVVDWIYRDMDVNPELMAEVTHRCLPECMLEY